MRSRWLVVIVVASLCLNVAVVGTYFLRRARHDRSRRFPPRGLAPEVREKLRQAREAAFSEFAALAEQEHAGDSLLWVEMRRESPDSARVESLCLGLGQTHGKMRAMVFMQLHRELRLMPAEARAEHLRQMMRMRPGFRGPGRMGRRPCRGPGMHPPLNEPPSGESPSGPPPETGD